MRVTHHHTSGPLISFVAMMILGCDGSTLPPTGPAGTGAIHITVSTRGANPDLDTDGYGVIVDGRGLMTISVQGAVMVDHLAPTTHFVSLYGLASNCSTADSNVRWVDVVAGGLAELAYDVECHVPTDSDCAGCWDWSQSALPSTYDIVSVKGRVFKPDRVP